jgi:cytochrome b561
MQLANTQGRYGGAAILLHWLMAAMIVTLVALGIYMVALPDVGFDKRKVILILVHKEIGVAVMAIALVRLAWRQVNPLPRLETTTPEWQRVAAVFVHLSFYSLMLAQPVIGWLMSSAAGIPVDFLSLFTLPDLVWHNESLFGQLRRLHDWLGYAIALLILLHAGAALRHHFILRDDTLRKMVGTWRS